MPRDPKMGMLSVGNQQSLSVGLDTRHEDDQRGNCGLHEFDSDRWIHHVLLEYHFFSLKMLRAATQTPHPSTATNVTGFGAYSNTFHVALHQSMTIQRLSSSTYSRDFRDLTKKSQLNQQLAFVS